MSNSSGSARRSLLVIVAIIVIGLLLLAFFSRRNENPEPALGSEATLSGDAILVCSDPCLKRGQCGSVDARWVVLLSSSGPATSAHDLTYAVDSNVTIVQQQMALVEGVSGPSTPWREAFYQVTLADQTPAWVAGWCIMQ